MSNFTNNEGGVYLAATSRRSILEQTKFSRLPKLPSRASNLVTATKTVCVACSASLRNESAFAQRVKVCAACMRIYAVIDNAISAANENRAYSGDK